MSSFFLLSISSFVGLELSSKEEIDCLFWIARVSKSEISFSGSYRFICIEGFFYTGVMFNYCFKEKPKSLKVILLTLAYTFLGMACRYLLEFGEVSNTYNFTAENIALHILMSCLVTYFGWFWYRRKSENWKKYPLESSCILSFGRSSFFLCIVIYIYKYYI